MSHTFRDTGNKYGPELDEYLRCKYQDRVSSSRASQALTEDKIQHAIRSLCTPDDVSFVTFETILATEQSPYYSYLVDLLLSESGIAVFPACIKLLRAYCEEEGRGLLDDAYGFLCLQVIALAVDVGKLAQTNQLGPFLAEMLLKDPYQPISGSFNNRVRHLEAQVSYGSEKYRITWLLGWHPDTRTHHVTCLPLIGGCTFHDVRFLLKQMWAARREFLRAARYAADIFPGWCGLLYVLENTLVQHFRSHNVNAGVDTSEQKTCWIHFLEILYRYSLCCGEIEDQIVPHLLKGRPQFAKTFFDPVGTAVDASDSDQIVDGYLKKLKRLPTHDDLHAYVSMLFGYACSNFKLNRIEFESNLSRITEATFERAWVKLSAAHNMNHNEWEYFAVHVIDIPPFLVGMCVPNKTKIPALMTIVASAELFELLGRLMLFPLSPLGEKMMSSRTREWELEPQEILQGLGSILKTRIKDAVQTEQLFASWYKTLECFSFHRFITRNKGEREWEYALTWELVWLHLGESLGLQQLLSPPIRCAYPRCAAPNTELGWKCAGCHAKHYCSRRCQHIDWTHPPNAHMIHCSRE